MEITKEDAVEIFLMHLKTEYPESASLVENISARDFEEVEELTVKENTIQGEACWQITLYLDMEDWVTLENGGRLSGYGADISVNTGSILHGSPTK